MSWRAAAERLGGPLFHLARGARDAARCWKAKAPLAPYGTDALGCEALIAFIARRGLLRVPGDLLEIGAGLGGGALKLSLWLERQGSDKTLHVVDDFQRDWTREELGVEDLYLPALRRCYAGLSQRNVFDRVLGARPNVKVWAADSAKLDAPGLLCFGLVNGRREPRYIENDFSLVWDSLAPGGAVALAGYQGYSPAVTKTIDALVAARETELAQTQLDARKHLLFALKNAR